MREKGANWTIQHAPIKLLEKFEEVPIDLENEITYKYMVLKGWKNVRGGDFCFKDLNYHDTPLSTSRQVKSGVFILELENNKYFIGFSDSIEAEIEKHFTGNGNKWTILHTPVEVIDKIKAKSVEHQRVHTLIYMEKYGWKNVRGYRWTDIHLKRPKELE